MINLYELEELTIEEQLELMKLEDEEREQEKLLTPNKSLRNKIRRNKEKSLYERIPKNRYTHSGIYLKTNEDTGDKFLSRYYCGRRKYINKETNKRIRKDKYGSYKRCDYKKNI